MANYMCEPSKEAGQMKTAFNAIVGTLLGSWIAVNPANSLAQDVLPVSHPPKQDMTRPLTSVQKDDAARHYSRNNPKGLGVFINLANPPELPPNQIVNVLKGAMQPKNISSHFEINQSKTGDLTTITFYREGVPFTFTLGEAPAGFASITQDMGSKPQELHSALH